MNDTKRFIVTNAVILATLLAFAVFLVVILATPTTAASVGTKQDGGVDPKVGLAIGAGLAIGLAGLGAGVGMGSACSAAIGAITEKPEMLGQSLIFIVLIEAIAIYGFVVAFLLYAQLIA
ncbi:MAG: ATP synthase subunit C [Promethearchaeota archaeon]